MKLAVLKETNDQNIKKSDALNEKKMDAIQKDILDKVEKFQKDTVEIQERQKKMEAALNRGERSGDDKGLTKERAKAFDTWMRDVNTKGNLEILDAKQAEIKELSTEVNPDGGYLVRPEFSDFIVKREFETSPVRQVANNEIIGAKSLIMDIDDDEAGADWVGEGGTVSETTTPPVGRLEITAHKLFADPRATEEMLEDGHFDVENWLMRKVSERFGRLENTAFTVGNGVGRPKGIMSYTAWAVNGTYERNKLEQINSGDANLITADGLIDLQNALLEIYQSNATWLMKRGTYGAVMKLKDGQGRYLFNMSLDNNTGLPMIMLLNRPVLFADDIVAIASNALAVAYGDFRVGYTVVDRRGITVLRDPFSNKGKVEFYTTKRTGGAVTNFQAIKIQKIAA